MHLSQLQLHCRGPEFVGEMDKKIKMFLVKKSYESNEVECVCVFELI